MGPCPRARAVTASFLSSLTDFAKLTKCIAHKTITAIFVSSAVIEQWVAYYGPLDKILSDQRPQLMSKVFIAVMKVLGIETVRTTAYHPQTKSQVKRYNRTIATQICHYVTEDARRWDELLTILTIAYSGKPHRSTGIAPFELVITRRVPNLWVRNLPPGTSLKPRGTLSEGSPLAQNREVVTRLRLHIRPSWRHFANRGNVTNVTLTPASTWERDKNLPRNIVIRHLR